MLDCSIAGIDRSAMPDHEELDSLPSINLETSHREEVSTQNINLKIKFKKALSKHYLIK